MDHCILTIGHRVEKEMKNRRFFYNILAIPYASRRNTFLMSGVALSFEKKIVRCKLNYHYYHNLLIISQLRTWMVFIRS